MSASSPADVWHGLLRPDVELAPAFWNELSATMRAAKLTFGDRVHCPFLRPIFLDPRDVSRVAQVAETLADVGERVVQASLQDTSILDAVGLTDAERPLFAIEPGYARASTASRRPIGTWTAAPIGRRGRPWRPSSTRSRPIATCRRRGSRPAGTRRP